MKYFFLALLLAGSGKLVAQHDSVSSGNIPIYGRFNFGVLTGERASASFQLASGVRLGKHLETGFGFGFENHYYSGYAPLFAEVRYQIGKGESFPFIDIMGGYMASLNQSYSASGGYTIGSHIGVTHYFTKHFGITAAIGYRFVQVNNSYIYYLWDGSQSDIIYRLNRFEMRIGIAFR